MGLNKKSCLKNPNFPQYLPLSNMVRKTNFLNISAVISEIVTFMSKKKSSLRIFPKMLQNNREVYLAICDSLSGEKTFFVYLSPFRDLI